MWDVMKCKTECIKMRNGNARELQKVTESAEIECTENKGQYTNSLWITELNVLKVLSCHALKC